MVALPAALNLGLEDLKRCQSNRWMFNEQREERLLAFPLYALPQVPWQQEGSPESPDLDLRYFSRGLFNHPLLVYLDGIFGKASLRRDASVVQNASAALWGPTASTCALMDWPLRKMLCGLVLSKTKCVRSSSL
eukprot:scaffold17347_cov15-Tisochrysis_lutea.AAC.1